MSVSVPTDFLPAIVRSHAALLEACKWLVQYHDDPAQPIVTLDEYLSRARAAIAKAEGK